MIPITDIALFQYFKRRQKKIEAVINDPLKFQRKLLRQILNKNKKTTFGKRYAFSKIFTYKEFRNNVPLFTYEELFPYIQKILNNGDNILVPGKVNWFAKSSGTSNDRSKYIPVTKNYLRHGHLKCAWDAASFIYNEDPSAKLFANKTLIMAGHLEKLNHNKVAGDISAIIINHFPKIGRRFYTPDFETALLKNWDEKIKETARITANEKVTLLAGVPTWTIVLLKEILKQTGKKNISEVWPDLRSFLHGGVSFDSYHNTFKELIPSSKVAFREVYNASEGYFAMQNQKDDKSMLLLCDHQIFYEFIPYHEITYKNPSCYDLSKVRKGEKYEMVISTMSGLYRYRLGDIIQFESVFPFKIKVTGRTQGFINVFGEEVSEKNADEALAKTCAYFKSDILEYTIGPRYLTNKEKGRHEWFIEFINAPLDLSKFEEYLDKELRRLNSDYDAKRSDNLAIGLLKIFKLPTGSFEKWQRSKNKYGGQNKTQRLRNDRILIESLREINL